MIYAAFTGLICRPLSFICAFRGEICPWSRPVLSTMHRVEDRFPSTIVGGSLRAAVLFGVEQRPRNPPRRETAGVRRRALGSVAKPVQRWLTRVGIPKYFPMLRLPARFLLAGGNSRSSRTPSFESSSYQEFRIPVRRRIDPTDDGVSVKSALRAISEAGSLDRANRVHRTPREYDVRLGKG